MNEPQKHILQHMTRGQRIQFEASVRLGDRRLAQIIWNNTLETCAVYCDTIPDSAGGPTPREGGIHSNGPAGRPDTSVESTSDSTRQPRSDHG